MSEKNSAKAGKTANKKGLIDFFKDVKAEVKIITWPSKNETQKAFVAVLVFTIIYILLVGGLDAIFNHLFTMILKLK